MEDLSEENIKRNCPHCDTSSEAFKYLLEETTGFWIVADRHPLCEGHALIIPKEHLSCIGEYSASLFDEFLGIYEKYRNIIKKIYGKVSSFEHGKFGQTVFHSHVHILPFSGSQTEIVPEGGNKIKQIDNLKSLKEIYQQDGGYLFFSIGDVAWVVDANLAQPRFFRDRFARALGRPERGNWKEMHLSEKLSEEGNKENEVFKNKLARL